MFILPPSEFDPEPGYPEAQAVIGSVVEALQAAKPGKALCLWTVGAMGGKLEIVARFPDHDVKIKNFSEPRI